VDRIPNIGELVNARGFAFRQPGRVVRIRVMRCEAMVDFGGCVLRVPFAELVEVDDATTMKAATTSASSSASAGGES
jgi:hypothetical protein